MCRMVVCLNNHIWREFRSAYDLFRHEIMHGLGFGMLYPQVDSKKALESKIISWRTSSTTQQLIKEHHLDFSENDALEFARSHFNCNKIEGIHAENGGKFHLSEYHYGVSVPSAK